MQTLGSAPRRRTLIASGLAVALLGGGVAASQFLAADAADPVAPAATSAPSRVLPTVGSSSPGAEESVLELPTPTPSATPTPTPGFYCKVTDDQIRELHPSAEPRDRDGSRFWYENDQLIGVTHEGVGRVDPCTVS
ncbi:hypothetical protein ACTQ49_08300 [Luteococcus sp. Sow4_B9]|uniref:hypothetical protein n=1 Tax=Luteococcus sp. Sow4_B9 TaxID=3438792 RepID=UPI003F9A0AA8